MSSSNSQRYFTLEEANQALQVIRPLVEQVLLIRQGILERQPEAWPAVEKAAGNGGNYAASEMAQEFKRLDEVIRQIVAQGVIFRDINTGLIDFLSLREEREVYLCWKYGEDQVSYWHDLDTGFTGRQPL